jgi:pimeloyl-ACP methyl ester carboxylesterase
MTLFFRSYGEGQPIIMLHGLFGMSDYFIPYAKILSQKYKVIIPDLRNHGQSPQSDDFSYDFLMNDVLELMRDLEISSACFIGHSMGGKIAMHTALTNSNVVEKAIIIDIAPVKYLDSNKDEFISAFKNLNISGVESISDIKNRVEILTSNPIIQNFILKNIQFKSNKKAEWKPNVDYILKNLSKIQDFPTAENKIFNKPILFVGGEDSEYFQEKYFPKINEYFPNNTIQIFENAGHWLHVENSTMLINSIQEFLGKSS